MAYSRSKKKWFWLIGGLIAGATFYKTIRGWLSKIPVLNDVIDKQAEK